MLGWLKASEEGRAGQARKGMLAMASRVCASGLKSREKKSIDFKSNYRIAHTNVLSKHWK